MTAAKEINVENLETVKEQNSFRRFKEGDTSVSWALYYVFFTIGDTDLLLVLHHYQRTNKFKRSM